MSGNIVIYGGSSYNRVIGYCTGYWQTFRLQSGYVWREKIVKNDIEFHREKGKEGNRRRKVDIDIDCNGARRSIHHAMRQ